MKTKKMTAILMTAALTAGILSGCGGSEKEVASAGTEDGQGIVELTFYNADGKEDPWTDPVALALTEATGVKLKTDYPVSSDDQKVALMIAEQNYPDMIYAKGDAGSLIEAGALIDL